MRVPEYFLFDLSRDRIDAGLRGYRLVGDEYREVEPHPDGRLESEQLGLELAGEGRRLRFYRPGSSEPLPSPREHAERAEAELTRLRAELERLRGGG